MNIRSVNLMLADSCMGFFRNHIDNQRFGKASYKPSQRAIKYGGMTMYNTGALYKSFFISDVSDKKLSFTIGNKKDYIKYHERIIKASDERVYEVKNASVFVDEFGTRKSVQDVTWSYNENMGAIKLPTRSVMDLDSNDLTNLCSLAKNIMVSQGLIVEE